MSRRFAKSMLMILSYCAAQSYWSSTCVLRIGDAEFNQLKADLRECKAECASLWEKVSKLEDSARKDHIEVEKSPKETDEQITKIYNIIMNLKDAEEAGVEVIILNGKVLCADSKLEYDVYKKLNEKQKRAIKLAVGCGDKVEYTNSELLLDGKIVEEYICNDQYKFGGITEAGNQILTQDEYNNSLFDEQKTFLKMHKDVVPVKDGPVVRFERKGLMIPWGVIKKLRR